MATEEQVDIVVNAQDEAMRRLWDNWRNGVKGAERDAESLGSRLNILGASAGDWMRTLGREILGIGSALDVVRRVGDLVRAEYENFLARNRAASDTQIDFAEAQRRFASNLRPGTNLDAVSRQLLSAAGTYGVQPGVAGLAFSQILSTKGSELSDQQALTATVAAMRLRPGPRTDVDTLAWLGMASSSLERAIGTNPEQSIAWTLALERANRSKDLESLTKYGITGITNALAYGGTPEEAAAIQTAIGVRSEDPFGRRTRTAMINYFKQLRVKTAPMIGPDASPMEMINFIANTPRGHELGRSLLGPLYKGDARAMTEQQPGVVDEITERLIGPDIKLKGEAPTFIALTELLQPGDNPTKRYLRAAQREIPSPYSRENLENMYRMERQLAGSQYQQAAITDYNLAGATNQYRIEDTIAGVTGSVRGRLPDLLQARGVSKFGQRLAAGIFDARSAVAGSVNDVYAAEIAALEGARERPQNSGFDWSGYQTASGTLTDEQKRTNEKLDRLIETVRNQMTIKIEDQDNLHQRATSGANRAGQ